MYSINGFSGWAKVIEAGLGKSGPATILTDSTTGTKVRIYSTPGEEMPYFRVQNKGGGYMDSNGVFPSGASRQALRDLTLTLINRREKHDIGKKHRYP